MKAEYQVVRVYGTQHDPSYGEWREAEPLTVDIVGQGERIFEHRINIGISNEAVEHEGIILVRIRKKEGE